MQGHKTHPAPVNKFDRKGRQLETRAPKEATVGNLDWTLSLFGQPRQQTIRVTTMTWIS